MAPATACYLPPPVAARRARRTSPTAAPAPAIPIWRNGVHLRGTPLWFDAQKPREICFASSADAVAALRHGQLICTRPTASLLARRARDSRPASVLAVPYGRPFGLGTTRFELFRSGAALGGASLLIEHGGERIVYAGPVNPHGGGLGGAADHRRCDVLIVDADYAHARFTFPSVDEAIAATLAFARTALADGAVPVLLVTTASKGLDVAAALAPLGRPVRAHRAIHHAAQRLRADGEPAPRLRRWSGAPSAGEIVVWPAAAARPPGLARARAALVSGLACDPERAAALGVDAAIPWSARADYAELVRYIVASGATRVYATGRYADAMAVQFDAVPLAPPRQLSLL